jgi:hypothetical protein
VYVRPYDSAANQFLVRVVNTSPDLAPHGGARIGHGGTGGGDLLGSSEAPARLQIGASSSSSSAMSSNASSCASHAGCYTGHINDVRMRSNALPAVGPNS